MKDIIGNTPLIRIIYKNKGKIRDFYAKLEWYNLSGSIKDRIVNYIIEKNIKGKKIYKTLVEATSGNTGISVAAIGAKYKKKVVIFMPDFVSKERVKIMRSYGAKVYLIKREEGGFEKAIELAKRYSEENNAFYINQFDNIDNIMCHYKKTGTEIDKKISDIDCFINGIGSGGTIMGVGKKLKERNENLKIILTEPEESPLFSEGKVGTHSIQGIGDDFIPSIVDKNMIDEIIKVNSNDSIMMSKKIAKELGLGVGFSSGANIIASIIKRETENKVVTIFADDNKKYLSEKNNSKNKDFIKDIKFIKYEVI